MVELSPFEFLDRLADLVPPPRKHRDLAIALGTTAVMESLTRTAVGPFERARSLAMAAVTLESVRAAMLPAVAAVPLVPRFTLGDDVLAKAVRGGLVAVGHEPAGALAAVDEAGDLVGILKQHKSGLYRLRPNFRGEG